MPHTALSVCGEWKNPSPDAASAARAVDRPRRARGRIAQRANRGAAGWRDWVQAACLNNPIKRARAVAAAGPMAPQEGTLMSNNDPNGTIGHDPAKQRWQDRVAALSPLAREVYEKVLQHDNPMDFADVPVLPDGANM